MTDEKQAPEQDEELTEDTAAITCYPIQMDGVPCVIMKFDRPVDHLVFDYDELYATFEAAIQSMEAAKSDDIFDT